MQRLVIPGVKNVIAIASGKGGVGKSSVTLNLALALSKKGFKVGLLDADIYGPSIPLMMNLDEQPTSTPGADGVERVIPLEKFGIQAMSMGLLVPPDQPVVWRGPMVHSALTQFLTQVDWKNLDYLLIDMPPGTGDAQLTISQNAPLTGAIIVTTPQEVSVLDARKGLLMFQRVQVPVLGIVENMADFVCGHCQKHSSIFGENGGKELAAQTGVDWLASLPIDPAIRICADKGESLFFFFFNSTAVKAFEALAEKITAKMSDSNLAFKPVNLNWSENALSH